MWVIIKYQYSCINTTYSARKSIRKAQMQCNQTRFTLCTRTHKRSCAFSSAPSGSVPQHVLLHWAHLRCFRYSMFCPQSLSSVMASWTFRSQTLILYQTVSPAAVCWPRKIGKPLLPPLCFWFRARSGNVLEMRSYLNLRHCSTNFNNIALRRYFIITFTQSESSQSCIFSIKYTVRLETINIRSLGLNQLIISLGLNHFTDGFTTRRNPSSGSAVFVLWSVALISDMITQMKNIRQSGRLPKYSSSNVLITPCESRNHVVERCQMTDLRCRTILHARTLVVQ